MIRSVLCAYLIFTATAYATSDKFKLGQFLFFDKVLSGNKNISCATCHHPLAGTGDGLALSVGEGGQGLGVTRGLGIGNSKVHKRVPRNAPHIFNMDPEELTTIFHDGRIEVGEKYPSGFFSPAKHDLPEGLDNIVAVQAIFPITSGDEMAGQASENQIGKYASEGDLVNVWKEVTNRVTAIDEYVELFKKVYPSIKNKNEISITHIGNAIAEYEINGFKTMKSPYDKYINGDPEALNPSQIKGMELFNGKAKCSSCHSGKLFTDNKFHSIAMPQIGPGKGVGFRKQEDYGRELVTNERSDRYKFRTLPLRNVAITGPWGHAGAYDTLLGVVKHHLNPVASLLSFDQSQVNIPYDKHLSSKDFTIMNAKGILILISRTSAIDKIELSEKEINDLINFLHALTDRACLDMRHLVPKYVPSKISINE